MITCRKLLTQIAYILFLVVCCFFHESSYAQNGSQIKGRVTDENGSPIKEASVVAKNNTTGFTSGAKTDSNGIFSFYNLPAGKPYSFTISYVGYETLSLSGYSINDKSNISLLAKLRSQTAALNEVVVVGYGTSKRKDVTSSITSIKVDQSPLVDLPNANPLLTLSSVVPGLNINPQSLAGQDPLASMNIRGEHSIDKNGTGLNKPLLVVDGIIFNGTINEISPQDVATIDVLKDASAVAIYGSRSSNGVIIITTKRGKSKKPIISLNASYGLQDWSRKPAMQDNVKIFLQNRWDYHMNRGDIPAGTAFNPSMVMNSVELNAYQHGVFTNWLDVITQKAPVQNYNVSVSGGGDHMNYYMSAGRFDQQGVILNDQYNRLTFLGKLETEINQYIKVGGRVNYYTADNSGLKPKFQESTWMSPLSYTTNQTPGYESWIPSNPAGGSTSPLIGSTVRPGPAYATNKVGDRIVDGTGWLEIREPWIKGLSYKFSVNGTLDDGVNNQMLDPRFFVDTRVPSQMDNYNSLYLSRVTGYAQTSNRSTWLMDQVLSYSNSFGKHAVDAIVGYTRDASTSDVLLATGTGFNMPDPLSWDGLNLATSQTISKTQVRYQNVGSMARLAYNYDGKYYLAGSIRRDGFSGFAPGHKFGTFSGVSGGWTISKASFMDALKWIDYLKIRLSYGQTGNQGISPYQTLSTVGTDYNVYGSNSQLDLYPTSMSNNNLTWSTTATTNLGIDFHLLKNRLSGSLDIYDAQTTDQLLTRSIPILTGYSSVLTNVGRVDNKGIEAVLNGVAIQGDGRNRLRWEPSMVFALNRNKLVQLYGTYDQHGNPINDIGNTPSGDAYIVGKSIHSVWDLKMQGIVQASDKDYIQRYGAKPGDVKFLDHNNDGKINANDQFYQGDRDPLFTTNLNNTISYKNFVLYFSLKWTAGNKNHFLGRNPYGTMVSTGVSGFAQLKDVTPWTAANPNNEFPRVDWTNGNGYQFWRNREFVKLKDVTLSYNLNQAMFSKLKIQAARIFVSANNVLTITKWNGLDPEDGGIIASQPGSNYNWSYPVLRTFTMGAVLSF